MLLRRGTMNIDAYGAALEVGPIALHTQSVTIENSADPRRRLDHGHLAGERLTYIADATPVGVRCPSLRTNSHQLAPKRGKPSAWGLLEIDGHLALTGERREGLVIGIQARHQARCRHVSHQMEERDALFPRLRTLVRSATADSAA